MAKWETAKWETAKWEDTVMGDCLREQEGKPFQYVTSYLG